MGNKLFATVDNPAIRRIVTRYASWVVNPRFPDDLAHQTGNQISLQHRSKSELRLIIRFLDMAKARGFDLSTLPSGCSMSSPQTSVAQAVAAWPRS